MKQEVDFIVGSRFQIKRKGCIPCECLRLLVGWVVSGNRPSLDLAAIGGTWLNLITRIASIPSALIMKLNENTIEVYVKSENPGNPHGAREKAKLGLGLYCETDGSWLQGFSYICPRLPPRDYYGRLYTYINSSTQPVAAIKNRIINK